MFCDEKARNGKSSVFFTKVRSARIVSYAAHTGAPKPSGTASRWQFFYIFYASEVHFRTPPCGGALVPGPKPRTPGAPPEAKKCAFRFFLSTLALKRCESTFFHFFRFFLLVRRRHRQRPLEPQKTSPFVNSEFSICLASSTTQTFHTERRALGATCAFSES